jgi:hypothetical protein
MATTDPLMKAIAVTLIAPWLFALTAQASPAGSCIAARLKAAARKTSGELKCYATAAKRGTDVDSSCLMKAEEKFNATWSRIEASGGCAAPEDASTIEFNVISYVMNLVLEVSCGNADGTCGGDCSQLLLHRELSGTGGALPLPRVHDDLPADHLDDLDDFHDAPVNDARDRGRRPHG